MAKMVGGATIWDRLLSLSLISTKLLLIIVLLASLYGLPYLLDVAVVCELLGFMVIVFISLFLRSHKKERRASQPGSTKKGGGEE
jgi:multisubunit Na+/H+ antiporter MnhF subunit